MKTLIVIILFSMFGCSSEPRPKKYVKIRLSSGKIIECTAIGSSGYADGCKDGNTYINQVNMEILP